MTDFPEIGFTWARWKRLQRQQQQLFKDEEEEEKERGNKKCQGEKKTRVKVAKNWKAEELIFYPFFCQDPEASIHRFTSTHKKRRNS